MSLLSFSGNRSVKSFYSYSHSSLSDYFGARREVLLRWSSWKGKFHFVNYGFMQMGFAIYISRSRKSILSFGNMYFKMAMVFFFTFDRCHFRFVGLFESFLGHFFFVPFFTQARENWFSPLFANDIFESNLLLLECISMLCGGQL